MNEIPIKIFEYFSKKPQLQIATFKTVAGSPYSHVRITDVLTGLFGEGSALELPLAENKALSELIERTLYTQMYDGKKLQLRKTTNGFAAFPSQSGAAERAIAEIVERSAFLSCWFSQCRPHWFSEAELASSMSLEIMEEFSRFSKLGFQLRIGLVACVGKAHHVLVGCIQPNAGSFSAIFTTACARSLADGVSTIILNQDRALAYAIQFCNSKDIRGKVDIHSPQDHMDHYLSVAKCPAVDLYLSEGSFKVLEMPNVELDMWTVPLWNGQSTFVASAVATDAQDYFCGPATFRKLNRKSLRAVSPPRPFRINRAPHPLS